MKKIIQKIFLIVSIACLFSCGGNNETEPPLQAILSKVAVMNQINGVTPFIKQIRLSIDNYHDLVNVSFTISPKSGTFSKPVSVQYQKSYLDKKAFYNSSSRQILLPIFGLYAGYKNNITLVLNFIDGSSRIEKLEMSTIDYVETEKVYTAINIKQARTDDKLGFDFVAIKSALTTPVVVDTDGNIRWIGSGSSYSSTTVYSNNIFYIGAKNTTSLTILEFDGSSSSVLVPSSNKYTNFHHELNLGKTGLLAEMDGTINGIKILESMLVEINEKGEILKEWNLGEILKDVMTKGGDDPTNFVRDGSDWFHVNSAIYNRIDDTLIISSRENFVMCIDYETGKLKWLLGDTMKHWYVDFPSLRPHSLTLTSGIPPIGQHALSISPDGNLLLFNDGLGSLNNPANTAPGESRTFSAASKYAIHESSKTADQIWTFENERKVYSDICSSVYEKNQSYLINYAVAYNHTKAKLVGVDDSGKIAFDFEYPNVACNTSWNAFPIAFEGMFFK